jgi:hypothetical protein
MPEEKTIESDGPGATIVSALMTNINSRGDRSYEKYFELSKSLLKIPINKVIFIDKKVIHHFLQFANENTTIIPFEKESNYLYEYKDKLDNSEIKKNPTKDTIEYMFTMAYKTEFVRKAIQLNNYGAKQFIWMDIGIKHMINVSDEEFCEKVMRLRNISYNLHVRIPSIWNPDITYTCGEIYKEVLWYFAGSMFGGNISSLLEFADLTKETSLNIVKEKNMLMWEVNVWKLVYELDRWRFLYYICLHDISILDNY